MPKRWMPLLAACAAASFGAGAADFCERQPLDREVPAGMSGRYELVGKDPVTGAAYTGTLVVGYSRDAYALARTVRGVTVQGDAWIARCGADRIPVLLARYRTKPVTELHCMLHSDDGNYHRSSCRSRLGQGEPKGLEAWFQQP